MGSLAIFRTMKCSATDMQIGREFDGDEMFEHSFFYSIPYLKIVINIYALNSDEDY